MRLYSGAPYWLIRNGLDNRPVLHGAFPENGKFDVAVVGAGLTGALVADALSAERLSTVVLDRRDVAMGSTAATTALVSYELDIEQTRLATMIGSDDAARAYQISAGAVAELGRIAATLPADCGYRPRPSLYVASRASHTARLQREAELRQSCGLDAEFWPRRQVSRAYELRSFGALHTDCAAVIDPVRMTRGLLERATTRGATVLSYTELLRVRRRGGVSRLTTSRGTLQAELVVYATGYETPAALRPDITALHSTYALVTEPHDELGPLQDGCLIWETSRPYFYMRTTDDGRLLAGGADAPFQNPDRRDRVVRRRVRTIEQRLHHYLPGIATETAFAWGGTFAETPDGLPFIGPSPGAPGALFALGYGGNGITFGVVAAAMLRDVCLGKANDDARLFRLDR